MVQSIEDRIESESFLDYNDIYSLAVDIHYTLFKRRDIDTLYNFVTDSNYLVDTTKRIDSIYELTEDVQVQSSSILINQMNTQTYYNLQQSANSVYKLNHATVGDTSLQNVNKDPEYEKMMNRLWSGESSIENELQLLKLDSQIEKQTFVPQSISTNLEIEQYQVFFYSENAIIDFIIYRYVDGFRIINIRIREG